MFSMPVRMKQCRSISRMSQAELAARVGVQRSAVAQWERTGGTSPSVGHLAQVATVTGVCFEWLATGRGLTRLVGLDDTPAAEMNEFARDEFENRVLISMRRLSNRNRVMACRIIESMSA